MDIARKVVGVGSVGTRAWVLLMRGVDQGDPLILQAKEATASVLEGYTGASAFESHGQRVVEGQRLMQAYGDILLGWHHFPDGSRPDYYLRQLRDWKGSFDVAAFDPQALAFTPSTVHGPWPVRTHARVIGWRSRPTSTTRMRLIKRSPTSRLRTPTRTSRISPDSGGSQHRHDSRATWCVSGCWPQISFS